MYWQYCRGTDDGFLSQVLVHPAGTAGSRSTVSRDRQVHRDPHDRRGSDRNDNANQYTLCFFKKNVIYLTSTNQINILALESPGPLTRQSVHQSVSLCGKHASASRGLCDVSFALRQHPLRLSSQELWLLSFSPLSWKITNGFFHSFNLSCRNINWSQLDILFS